MSVQENVQAIADRIEADLRAVGTPERAEGSKAYMKSSLEHFGTSVPDQRRITRGAVRGLGREELLALVGELWATGVFDLRMAAVESLVFRVKLLRAQDLAVAERLIRDARMWALVDPLAAQVVGELVRADRSPLDAWARDPEFWIRRSSLLALLPGIRAGEPDLDRLSAFGDLMIGEKEFFVRKALGWVLREAGAKDPAWVAAWVGARIGEISGVTIREAVKPLTEADRSRLTAAYRAR